MAESGQAGTLHLAGVAAAARGDHSSAIELIGQALAREPFRSAWLRDLATLHFASRHWPEAVEFLHRESTLAPLDRRGLELLGLGWLHCGRADEAARILAVAVAQYPECAGTHLKLGRALRKAGDYNGALGAFTKALELAPNMVQAHQYLADLYTQLGSDYPALEQWEAVAAAKPGDPEARLWLARARFLAGDADGGLDAAQTLVDGGAAPREVHSEILGMLLHSAHQTPATIRTAHEAWGAAHCPKITVPPDHRNVPDPERRLRIGYISGEFKRGPLSHFLIPILRRHNRAEFEIIGYQSNPEADEYTDGYRTACTGWREAAGWTDDEFAENVRRDEIDILVDLSGHYDYCRLQVLAQRPAPVLVSLPGYPATTGVAAIDYIFSDRWVCPDGAEEQYTERVYRLPSGYLSYQPPAFAPAVTALPAFSRGHVRFGVFQRPAKLNADFWDAAAGILRRQPSSDLLVHYSAVELDDPDSDARRHQRDELSRRGVDPGRMSFLGPVTLERHLAELREVDVALDTFPYNGQTTTCECLWMGVPVVTLAGEAHVARVGFELMDRVGLGELVAADVPHYVGIALTLTEDLTRLAALRRSLRQQVEGSRLMDHHRIAREIEEGLRWMWRRWCHSGICQERQVDSQ